MSKTKKLSITITGPAGSGKTTLAMAFADFLYERGFMNVVVSDSDINHGTAAPHVQSQRLETIVDRTINISTKHTRK
jgi:adenylylsulfate kinase-like enzyme